MATAVGVFLVAVGAVLTFAVDATLPGIGVVPVGAILMLTGATAVTMTVMRWSPRRRVARPTPRTTPRVVLRRTVSS
jgi:Domain of unknown function (DUF6458)